MAQTSQKLRIAEFDNSFIPFPMPKGLALPRAPLEVALDIAEGLAKRGHEINFFGPRGSSSDVFHAVSADFEPLFTNDILNLPNIQSGEREKINALFDQYIVSMIFAQHQKNPFDILHIHAIDRALPFARLFPEAQIVYTIHDPIYAWRARLFQMFQTPNQHFISISNAQRKLAPALNYAATIYNGTDLAMFPFSGGKEGYLFFAGRLNENKGVYEAIMAAEAAGERLVIAGAPAEGEYWETKIKPHLNEKIQYVGMVPHEKLHEYYGNAKATLVPIRWEEPFGLVMTESMACGTPVIAFRRGSVPEVIVDGKTGFIVDTVEEMAKAIGKISEINRADCRKHVEEHFSIEKMVDGYEEAFLKIVGK